MKPEEFNAITQDIMSNLSDQAKVSTLLATLVQDYNDVNTETTKAIETANKLTKDNETLRQANMELFLKVGVTKKDEPSNNQNNNEDNTPKFEDLFDDKGNLK